MGDHRARVRVAALASALLVPGLAAPGAGAAHPATSPSVPSQSPAAARRDGVVPALAKLPFAIRVSVKASIRAREGVWVLSRPTAKAARGANGCRLGPETGKYPTDTICTTEYGEVLLLNARRDRILRAYPLPAVPPRYLVLSATAVYCGRPGSAARNEFALPDAMVCRIDRRSFAARVHVFAPREGSEVRQPCFFAPKNWVVTSGALAVAGLRVDAAGLRVLGAHGASTLLDSRSLAVLTH